MSEFYAQRVLRRDPERGWFLGVSVGFADFFGWSETSARLGLFIVLWLVSFWVSTGLAVLMYLGLAFIMPRTARADAAGLEGLDGAPFKRSYK